MSIWDLVVPCIFKFFQMQSWRSMELSFAKPFPAKHLPSPRNPSFSYPEAFQVPPDSHPVRKKCCFGGGSYLQRNRNWLQILDIFCRGNLRVFLEPFFLRRSCRLLNVMYIYIYLYFCWFQHSIRFFQIGQIWAQRLRKRWKAETGNYRICQIFGGRSGRYEGVSIKCRSWLVIVRSHVSNEK